MPSSTTVVSGGKWEGQEPVQENRDIIHYLDQYNPVPGQVGIPPQLGQPNSNGIYAYDAGVYATPLYYHYTGGSWQWSPDWNEVTEMVIAKGETSFVGKFSLEGTSLRVERIN
jgi:hypothetical protein